MNPRLPLALVIAALGLPLHADVTPALPFQNHAVLQQGRTSRNIASKSAYAQGTCHARALASEDAWLEWHSAT